MYLLDTNIVSDARKGSEKVAQWLRSVDPSGLYISVLTLGEIERGIAMKERRDSTAAFHLAKWLQQLREDHSDRFLPVTERISMAWGRLSAMRTRGDVDGLIAATAQVHDLVLVTRNVADFEDTGVVVFNPWDGLPS